VDFFNLINMLWGVVTEFCTKDSCPVMSAGPKYVSGRCFPHPHPSLYSCIVIVMLDTLPPFLVCASPITHYITILRTLSDVHRRNSRVSSMRCFLIPDPHSLLRYEYHWADGSNKKPVKVSAPDYVDHLFQWVQKQLDDETIFPSKIGVPFPKDFDAIVKNIFKRLFRVYACRLPPLMCTYTQTPHATHTHTHTHTTQYCHRRG